MILETFSYRLMTLALLIMALSLATQAQTPRTNTPQLVERVIKLGNPNAYFCCGSYDACAIVPSILASLKTFLSPHGEFEFDRQHHAVRVRDTKDRVKLMEHFFKRQEKIFQKQYPKPLKLKQDGFIFRQCTPGGGAEQLVSTRAAVACFLT